VRRFINARARNLADIRGGKTGLLVKDYKGRNADKPVYKAESSSCPRCVPPSASTISTSEWTSCLVQAMPG
jgi:hypothetical protein